MKARVTYLTALVVSAVAGAALAQETGLERAAAAVAREGRPDANRVEAQDYIPARYRQRSPVAAAAPAQAAAATDGGASFVPYGGAVDPNSIKSPSGYPAQLLGVVAELRWRDAIRPYNFAVDFAGSRDYLSALRLFKKAVQARPDFPEAQLGLGLTLVRMGQAAAAVPHLQEACRLRPEYAEAQVALAQALRAAGPQAAAAH